MKNRIVWTAGSWMIAAALVATPVFAEETITAAEASADAVAATVEAAEESVDEAVETVQEIGEELGITQEAAATQAEAATQPADAEAATADTATDAGGQMDPDMAAAMAQWMANANPGDHHAKLDAFAGSWDVTTHYWMAPGAPPQVNSGTSKIKWILDGRFLVEKFSSTVEMPGMPPQEFKGFGMTGYDNAKGEYVATWSDTMSTALVTSSGQFDDSTQTLTLSNSFDCPMDGPCNMRMILTVVGPDELIMKAYKTPESGEETQAMEIVYKRQASM